MWAFITRLVYQIAAIRLLFRLGWVALFLPLAALLKVIGLPVLLILFVLGLPILFLLLLFGLPIILVLVFGGLIIGFLGMVLTIGVVAIKFAIFVVLPIWLMWKLACWVFRGFRRGGGDSAGSSGESSSEPVEPIDPGTPPDLGADPAV